MQQPINLRVVSIFLLLLFLVPANQATAQEVAGCCGKVITVTGDVHHSKLPAGAPVEGAAREEVFADEIFGKTLTASAGDFTPGRYRVVIDLAETYVHESGERLMDVSVNGQSIAANYDICKSAGGFAKACQLSAETSVTADSPGTIEIVFTAQKEKAKFNAITIYDAHNKIVASVLAGDLEDLADVQAAKEPVVAEPVIYTDPTLPTDKRVDDLIRRLSLKEKVAQLQNSTPAIARLNVPAYNYWNEALHGVGRAGRATVFPQAMGLSATWDTTLMQQVGDVIATEARAKYHEAIRQNNHDQYYGLTFWDPNINIVRDPRWGRAQETYGEDPYLTSRMAVAVIHGLQGDDPHYLKTLACAKHFAVHSGPEPLRHSFNAEPPERDFYDTYLPQFEAAVREGHVESIMGSYNRVYGSPACASPLLLQDILRKRWGFDGYVVSDCGAVTDIFTGHKVAAGEAEAAAMAIKAGCDIECGGTYHFLVQALNQKLLSEADINLALHRVLTGRFRLGMFDPQDKVPYSKIPYSEVDCPAHRELALKAARESIVLLKNTGLLPLDKTKVRRIAVIGPNADATRMLAGNYNGTPTNTVNILQGIRNAVGPDVEVISEQGCSLVQNWYPPTNPDDLEEAVRVARGADVIIFVGGLDPYLECEESGTHLDGFKGGDRTRIELPATQTQLIQALFKTGKPVVFINCSGSSIAMPWEAGHLPAILQAWYPGQAGGTAVADVLFGNYNPAGRLPLTFYKATTDLPAFEDYSMANRTYRYFTGQPLFPFGHGLSYTTFKYDSLKLASDSLPADGTMQVSVDVTNTGDRDGEEVVQLYARRSGDAGGAHFPLLQLIGFDRVNVAKGAASNVTLKIPASQLRHWNAASKRYEVDQGDYEIWAGASSGDLRLKTVLHVMP